MVLKVVRHIREDEPRIGTRKLQDRLEKQKKVIGRDKLFSLLREHRLLVPPKRSPVKTTYSRHSYAVAPNRVKNLTVTAPNQVFVSDITYLFIKQEKPAYLFLVSDLHSRKILGHHVTRDMSHYSAVLALNKALEQISDSSGIIHHSDRGSQYCCHEYLKELGRHQMIPSMTDENHCYQNAVAERINGILKIDLAMDQLFESFEHMQGELEKAISVYNHKRTHWSLNLKTPQEVYSQAA